jgi:iron complex outermembrane recepter protein
MRRIPYLLLFFTLAVRPDVFAQLPDTTILLPVVEVTAFELPERSYHVEHLDRRRIEGLPLRDVGEALRALPNIGGIRKGGAVLDPVVRGFKYSQLNVQLNGGQKIEGGCPNRMDPAAAHIDVDDIQSLEVIKGPFALRYGPNFGGVINLKTIRPVPGKEFKIHAAAMMGYESNWNGFKHRLSVDGGNNIVFFSLSGNIKKYGDYKDGSGRVVKSSFERSNYTARLGFSPFRNNYLVLAFDRSLGKNVMFPALPMDERSDNTTLASADYRSTDISPVFREFLFKVYLSDVSHLMDNKQRPFSDTVVALSDIDARNYGYRVEGRFDFGGHELSLGSDYEHILKDGFRTKSRILEPTMPETTEKLWNEAEIRNNGIFVLYHRATGKWMFDAAVRADFNRANSGKLSLVVMGNELYADADVESAFTNFSASAGTRYHISENFSLSLSVGRGVRSPDMNERFIILLPIGYDNYDYLGQPGLRPEANNEIDLAAQLTTPIGCLIEGGFFFSYVTDYISAALVPESIAKPQTKGVYGVKRFYNEDHVFLRGFELSYRSPEDKRWGVKAQAACTRGVNPETEHYIIQEGQITGMETVKNDPLPEIPPLEGTLGVFYKFFAGRLVPELSLRMVAGKKDISKAYAEEISPGFALLNFYFAYRHNDYLRVSGGVSNILDKSYYEHLNRRLIGGKGNLFEPGRVFFVNIYFTI